MQNDKPLLQQLQSNIDLRSDMIFAWETHDRDLEIVKREYILNMLAEDQKLMKRLYGYVRKLEKVQKKHESMFNAGCFADEE